MTAHHDPPRFRTMTGELPGELAAALAETGDDFPRADQLDDLTRRLGPLLGAASMAAAIPVATMAPKAPLTASAALKLAAIKWSHIVVLPLAIGAASGAAAWKATESTDVDPLPTSIETRTAAPAAKAQAKGSHVIEAAGTYEANRFPTGDEEIAAQKNPAARSALRAEGGDQRRGGRATPQLVATDEPIVPASEIELIDRAHRALARTPSEARRWAGEHERLYPDGTFVQERETLIIEALAREGRGAEARARADRFRARFPRSTYMQRIDSVLRSTTENSAPAK